MEYKYQLILLGSEVQAKPQILSKLFQKLKDLGLPKNILKTIESDKYSSQYLGNQPAFGVYFGDSNGNHKHLDITDKLLKDGTMILPVYFGTEEGAFSKEIPYILSNQNAIRF
ncbi:MAG: toll/interleukin-1 receptor domain-containing protein, partial [Bacteroidia bacterium]|nr:toll/interleukin-1 receptor domain-containing protein [Bacteroidia bacterium]